jgi:hypothetical protein
MGQTLQQIIQGLLDKVRTMVNTPGNNYYLPTWIANNGYDPYGTKIAMNWGVTLTDPSVIEAASGVCGTVQIVKDNCPGGSLSMGAPNSNPTLVLGGDQPGDMLVSGGSNAYISSLIADITNPYKINGHGSISSLPPPLAQNLVVSGNFTFTQYCCCSNDNTTCITTPAAVVGTGTFKATMNGSPQIGVSFEITKLAPNVLDIAVNGMTFTPPMKPGTQTPDITVTVDITNIPVGANRQSYNNMAEEAFNSSAALQNVSQQINAVMNDSGQLQFIGNLLTQVIDGYLRDNHQYPFGPAVLALR